MAEGTLALPQVAAARPIHRLVMLVPGILLLAAIGYLGKFIEQSISAYARANHLHLPNISTSCGRFSSVSRCRTRGDSSDIPAWRRHLRVLAQSWHRAAGFPFSTGRCTEARGTEPYAGSA